MADIMGVKEAAEKWGVTMRRVTEIIRSGRIEGVYKIGTSYVMPADTEKPPDGRAMNGEKVRARFKEKREKKAREEGTHE